MRISLQWLGDFLDLSEIDAARIEDILTTRVAEVDGVETCGRSLESALIAYVKSVRFLSPKQCAAESRRSRLMPPRSPVSARARGEVGQREPAPFDDRAAVVDR